jgi:hypothetical protein
MSWQLERRGKQEEGAGDKTHPQGHAPNNLLPPTKYTPPKVSTTSQQCHIIMNPSIIDQSIYEGSPHNPITSPKFHL